MTDESKKNDYGKKYYEKNKEKWFIYVDCSICGGKYNASTKYNHYKTKKHIIADKDKQLKDLQTKIDIFKENKNI